MHACCCKAVSGCEPLEQQQNSKASTTLDQQARLSVLDVAIASLFNRGHGVQWTNMTAASTALLKGMHALVHVSQEGIHVSAEEVH
eukprot:1317666-Amphidinium_carterae.1